MLPAAKVYKAFNTLGAELMSKPEIGGKPITMMYAGDKEEAAKELAGKVSRVSDQPHSLRTRINLNPARA